MATYMFVFCFVGLARIPSVMLPGHKSCILLPYTAYSATSALDIRALGIIVVGRVYGGTVHTYVVGPARAT